MRGESRWNFCICVSQLRCHRVQFFFDSALEFDFELEIGEIALEIRKV